ncbi:MAG: 3-hydroxyacyl-[acyl-carrier-protein] dehydratase FabZ [Porticoccaceae bacterium]|nr:3-hydroxyacyl-[acyl-carrier-protein] dehydratase FabZ [Porticoccaceae bacterium]|tara:strand:+ start:3598 stop:4035 length:438 start_codon:yes stop_codon:yes gene_type:complete
MDINEIMGLLPHRYPMLLVDRVTDVVKDEHIAGFKNVSINENIFNGHFPGTPILPGVIILEAMAQISGILGFFSSSQKVDDGMLYLFAGVDNVRFKLPVVPGDQLLLSSKVISVKRNIWRFRTAAKVGNKLASEATLLCAYRYRD